ncbi:MAG: hypothetical protein ABIH38_00125 [Patescibacteria group bacterium]
MKAFIWWFLLFPLAGPLLAGFLILLSQVGWKIGELAKRLKKDPSSESIKVSLGDFLSFLAYPVKLILPWWLLTFLLCILVEWHWLAKLIFAPIIAYLLFRQVRPWLSRIAVGQEEKGRFGRDAIKTLFFFIATTIAFLIFMSIRFPYVDLSPGNFFNAEWLKMNLMSALIWYAVMALGMAALFYSRIFWRGFGKFAILIIFLVVLGLQPGFMLEGTSHSIPFFMEIPGDSQLSSLMANTEPTRIIHPFIPKHKNDWRKLFPVKKGDVIAVNWEGYFRFGWGDLTGRKIDEGTVYYAEYAELLRDPYAHGRSPVIGAKDGKLKRVSSFKGPNDRQLKRTFFLAVMRESGEAVIFPTNAPKSNLFYGSRAEGYASFETIRVWHFPAKVFK